MCVFCAPLSARLVPGLSTLLSTYHEYISFGSLGAAEHFSDWFTPSHSPHGDSPGLPQITMLHLATKLALEPRLPSLCPWHIICKSTTPGAVLFMCAFRYLQILLLTLDYSHSQVWICVLEAWRISVVRTWLLNLDPKREATLGHLNQVQVHLAEYGKVKWTDN